MKRFSLILFLFLISSISFAQVSVWNGNNSKWTKGDGTESNPYLIESADHLACLAEYTSGGISTYAGTYFKLVTDIDLNGLDWNPINEFSGSFDGENHEVTGLTNSLFGKLKNAVICNLRINAQIYRSFYVSDYYTEYYGVLCCKAESSLIEHCLTKGSLRIKWVDYYKVSSSLYVAGISGYCFNTNIRKCLNYLSISTDEITGKIRAAGITFSGGYTQVEYCANFGDIVFELNFSSSSSAYGYAIGEFGNEKTSCVKNCYNTGNIYAYCKSSHKGEIGGSWNNYFAYISGDSLVSCYSLNTIKGLQEPVFGADKYYNINCFSLSSSYGVHTKTETAMKGDAFPEILNQGDSVFIKDITPNINGGYPIFAYQITEDPTYDTIKDGESYTYNNNVFTESGEYYYYEPDDWGAIKHLLNLEVEQKNVVVLIDANDSIMGHVTGSGRYKPNEDITVEAIPNNGYQFVKWSDEDTNPIRNITLGNEGLSLIAYFETSQIIGPEPIKTQLFGDFNNDGRITAEDVSHLVNVLIGRENPIEISGNYILNELKDEIP